MHFGIGDAAVLLQPLEQRRHRPGARIEHGDQIVLQHARHVFDQTAAGDVDHAVDFHRRHQCQQGLDVNAGRLHQHIGQFAAVEIAFQVRLGQFDDLAHQRVTVRVHARRCQAQHHVARGDLLAVNDLRLFDRADGEAGQVVFTGRVHAGHLGRFAADQRATSQFATARHALDDSGRGGHVELAAGEIIEEKQRLGALHQDVIDAHRDQVDADRVVPVQLERQLQLGAHAVGARHQHRLLVFLADFKQRAEAADAAHHAFAHRALGKRLDRFDQRIAGIDIDTGIAVRKGDIGRLIHGVGAEEAVKWKMETRLVRRRRQSVNTLF